MKTLKTTIAILALSILTFSCSKGDEAIKKVYESENPLAKYLINTGFINAVPSFPALGFYEVGFTFKPLVVGKIISISIKLPAVRNNIKVTIWDLQTQLVVFDNSFNVSTAASNMVFDINPLSLAANKDYVISMNTDSYYINSANIYNPVSISHPIIVGNISILNSRSKSGNTQMLPTMISTSSYSGNCSFNFQQTE